MDLTKTKQLEDLKAENKKLYEKRNAIVLEKRNKAAEDAIFDFKTFFSSKGFNVNRNTYYLTASYGTSTITLDIADPKVDYFGVQSVYELKILGGKSYRIVVNKFGVTPGFNVSFKNVDPHEDKLDKDIKDEQEAVEKNKDFIANSEQFELGYTYYDIALENTNPHIKTTERTYFKQFSEILNEIFK